MATCTFRSPLASRLQAFWEMRVALGRKGTNDRKILTYLDHFLMGELKPGRPITREIVERWFKHIEHLRPGTRINRISLLRQFCSYLSHFDPRTCVVHRTFLPCRTRPAPYIYSQKDVRAIIAAAQKIGPDGSLRPAVIATLIGLLYCAGLRIGEALKLTLADVDLEGQLLTIRETKFNKSRYVPLSPSAVHHLAVFLHQREEAGFSTVPTAPVFVNPEGRAYAQPRICTIFLEILRNLGLRGPKGEHGPRVHDFRHSFAINRLALWYRQGGNINAKLPLLATYLGHASITGTEVYLHATAELLEKTSRRFHNRFAIPPLKRKKEVPHVEEP
jgi:integrase/recombinase XerD